MKIAYFINTFKSINWGGQATSSGIKYFLSKTYPKAEFVPMNLPDLPFKKVKLLRKIYEHRLFVAIMSDNEKLLLEALGSMRIKEDIFDEFTHICFNGEGAVHYKSGHLKLFMALLYLAKKKGKVVVAINQTVDLGSCKDLEYLVSKVYNLLDFVSVREPISYEYVKNIGVKDVKLIPDAVYGLKKMDQKEINERVDKYSLPKEYVTVTGSSFLKRNKSSLKKMKNLLKLIKDNIDIPIVFMANAKTDIWLAHKLKEEFDFIIIEPPVKYEDAMAIISKSKLLVGGRQHPNIFAYIYKVPYIPFVGNTFKNDGVVQLQNYPIKPLSWDIEKSKFLKALEVIQNKSLLFKKEITIDSFDIFKKKDRYVNQVAIVVTNLAGSGAEKVALAQAKLFSDKGHEVVLFLLEDVKTYDIGSLGFPIVNLTKSKDAYKFLGRLGDKVYAKKLEAKMRTFGHFDIVISNLPRADRVVKLLNHSNKYFVIHMSYKAELEKFNLLRAKKKLKLYRYIYRDESIITITDAMIQDFKSLNIDYKSVQTIHNPFDFDCIRSKAQESIDIDYDYIISPSAFREQKRYDIMLDAFMLVKSDVKLLILAKKDSKLIEMIEQRGLSHRVEILGFQQNPYKYIKNAKLLVLSSDREGLPTVIIESLIVGTPVVSTDCPTGPKDILSGELSKWLVPTGDSKALASKIDEALSTHITIDDKSIERFNKDKIYEQFMKLL